MNHSQARQLIQAAADGLITDANRRALERHLAGCAQCQAYSINLNNLEAQLSRSLQTRWVDVQPRRFSLQQARAHSARQESPGLRRLYRVVAVPAVQFGALVVLAVGLILLIGSAAHNSTSSPPTQTPVPTLSLTEVSHTGPAEGACGAVAGLDARVYADHDAAAPVVGALPHGETAPAQAYYRDPQTGMVWIQVEVGGGQGWVKSTDIQVTGDCGHLPVVEPPTAQPASPTPSPAVVLATNTPFPVPTLPGGATCAMTAPSPQTMYADATLGAPAVGTWPEGAQASVIAWAHNGLPPSWFLIRYQGVTGWVWAPWYDPAIGAPCAGLALTAYPTLAPTDVTDVATPVDVCMVAPVDDPSTDPNIYTGPATFYPVIARIAPKVYVVATGIFSPPNYDTWVRVDFGGQVGWVRAGTWMFYGGGCYPLPPVDFQPLPPTLTPFPTAEPSDTPAPGATAPVPPPVDFAMTIPADLGSSQQFSASFPWQGSLAPLHHLAITVTGIPQVDGVDGQRILTATLGCSGDNLSNLNWGWGGSAWTSHCGDTLRSDVIVFSTSKLDLYVDVPITAADNITYTLSITVGSPSN